MKNIPRNLNIDVLRIASMFMVVVLHTSSSYFLQFHKYWSIGLFYDNLSRFSVPIFLMISGYLLLGKIEPTENFIKKRMGKVIVPFIVWTIFYIAIDFNAWRGSHDFFSLINRASYFHLWFIYAILFYYALTPVLRIFISNTDRFTFKFVIFLWVLYAPIYLCLYDIKSIFIDFSPMAAQSNVDTFMALSGFYLIGGYIKKYRPHINNKSFFILSFLSLSANFIAVYFSSVTYGGPLEVFFKYFTPFIAFFSILLFIKSCNITFKPGRSLSKIIETLSNICFGIYLVHAGLLPIAFKIINPEIDSFNALFTIPIISALVFLTSALICYILSKTPFLKRCI